MLNNRGDRDYSKDAGLLKNGDVHEHESGRGEFLLIQSYDMSVSTLTQAAVRARTSATGEKIVSFSERRLSLLRVEVYEALATATGEIRV